MNATHRIAGDRLTRPELLGQHCVLINTWGRGGPHNAQVELADGTRTACPVRTLRRLPAEPARKEPP